MAPAEHRRLARLRYIQRLAAQLCRKLCRMASLAEQRKLLLNRGAHLVCQLPDHGALLGADLSHAAQKLGQLSFFPKIPHAQLFQIRVRIGKALLRLLFDLQKHFLHSLFHPLFCLDFLCAEKISRGKKKKPSPRLLGAKTKKPPRYHPHFPPQSGTLLLHRLRCAAGTNYKNLSPVLLQREMPPPATAPLSACGMRSLSDLRTWIWLPSSLHFSLFTV